MGPAATNMGWIVMLDPGARLANRVREVAARRDRRDRGQRTRRPRGRHDHLIIVGLSGTGRIASGSTALDLRPHELALFLPETPQEYGSSRGPWRFCWIHFQPRSYWLGWLGWPRVGDGLHRVRLSCDEARRSVARERERLLDAAAGTHHRRDALAMNALEALLLAVDDDLMRQAAAHLDPRIERAMTWLQDRLDRAPPLAEVAAACGLSPSRLSHLFTAQVGHPPLRWHERERMRRAAQRLTDSPAPIKAVAADFGYDDPLYFSTRFKHHHGVSPRTFRQR